MARLWPGLLGLFLSGCGIGFDPSSELKTLRVLGVQKDHPYARPGDRVRLRMLWYDSRDPTRPIHRTWVPLSCINPPGEYYYGCYARWAEQAASLRSEASVPTQSSTGSAEELPAQSAGELSNQLSGLAQSELVLPELGDEFIVDIPESGVLATRVPGQTPYGVAYAFFAACTGTILLKLDLERGFPLVCKDAQGRYLGPDDFVAGYASIYVYEDVTNTNPVVTGIRVGDTECSCLSGREPDCPPGAGSESGKLPDPLSEMAPDDAAQEASAPTASGPPASESQDAARNACHYDCKDGGCALPQLHGSGQTGSRLPHLPACAYDGDQEKCPGYSLRVLVDPGSAEPDALALIEGQSLDEQMWVRYFVERGKVGSEVRLVNDARSGWNQDPGTDFYAPAQPGLMFVWAIVQDSRGGTSWVRQTLCIEGGSCSSLEELPRVGEQLVVSESGAEAEPGFIVAEPSSNRSYFCRLVFAASRATCTAPDSSGLTVSLSSVAECCGTLRLGADDPANGAGEDCMYECTLEAARPDS